jgi:lipopolysaccharide biosynthesis glycosyltransferase
VARIKRLLDDLRQPESRADALQRVRKRAASKLLDTVQRPGQAIAKRAAPVGPNGKQARTKRPRSWYVAHWSRLAGAVLGTDAPPKMSPRDAALARKTLARARRQAGQSVLAEGLARGDSLEQSVCRSVAALAEVMEWNPAWAMAEGVGRLPGGTTASALGHAVLLHRRRLFDRVWNLIRDVDVEALATHIPVEAVDAALAAGTSAARERARAVAAASQEMDATVLVDLAGRFLAFGEREQAADLVAELRRRPSVDLDERRRHSWNLIESWLGQTPAPVPAGAVPVAVMQYRTPDHVLTSGNLGDHIQTLALLGNLVRFSDVTFTGRDGLGELAGELQGLVRPDLRLPDVNGSVHLLELDRDFSSEGDIPEKTWMLAFGWHMHPLYDLRYDFPYHPNIRPLFISFHINRLDMLSDVAQEYLRRFGPVGCRDWNTVFLLLSAGIDAFFSGCLTTTVDALFPAREEVYGGGATVGLIDLPPGSADRGISNAQVYSHQSDEYRNLSVTDGVRLARASLSHYQRDLERAVTKRLHAYLPLTSLGVPVEYKIGTPGDVRLAGLTDLHPGDPALLEMRGGIRDMIATVFEKVATGADEDAVYGRWREVTRERVAEAKARFEAPLVVAPTTVDVAAAVATTRAGARRFGPHDDVDPDKITDIVLCFDQNLLFPAAVLLESIVANASGPVRLTLLGRGLGDDYPAWLAAAFPSVPMTIMPCDHIAYGPGGRSRRIPARITVSTMDRVLLPLICDNIDRIVYLDIDTVMLGDICVLARSDLAGTPIAARDSNVSEASEWRRAGLSLEQGLATDLRRRMGHLHGYGHAALNAGVLVMDLDRMRRDDFTATTFGWIEQFGLNDQDSMLVYAGPDRSVLDARWNSLPVLEDVHDPSLIHWASLGKPWEPHLTFAQDLWLPHAQQLQSRAGLPPTSGPSTTGATAIPGVVHVGPATAPLEPALESVIGAVLRERLSYLDAVSLRTLATTVRSIEAADVEGLIIETGTALGGSAITMAAAKSTARRMRIYDVFGMIPPPSEMDGPDVHRRYAAISSGNSKGIQGETYYGYRDDLVTEVTESFSRRGVKIGDNNVELIQGLFEDTLVVDEPVALAHLDGDWYASTMTCLTRIAPRLSVGGRIVLDDYDTWSGCRTAVNEYFAGRPGFRFEHRGRLHVVRI